MELRREFLLTIGALVLLNLCLAFGSIGLFVRMGPAIAHILEENVYSITAAEEILAELAEAGGSPMGPDQSARVHRLLGEAQRNITREEERAAFAALERSLPSAMDGDPDARRQAVTSIRQLVRTNREAMHRADEEARRLGSAGAWAAVLVGFLSFLLSVFVVVRLQRRFLRPLAELYEVLERARQGDRLRRCRMTDAPHEVVQVMQATNRLLDERLERARAHVTSGEV